MSFEAKNVEEIAAHVIRLLRIVESEDESTSQWDQINAILDTEGYSKNDLQTLLFGALGSYGNLVDLLKEHGVWSQLEEVPVDEWDFKNARPKEK